MSMTGMFLSRRAVRKLAEWRALTARMRKYAIATIHASRVRALATAASLAEMGEAFDTAFAEVNAHSLMVYLLEALGEAAEHSDSGRVGIWLPVIATMDRGLSCIVCGRNVCDFRFLAAHPVGLHRACAAPHLESRR